MTELDSMSAPTHASLAASRQHKSPKLDSAHSLKSFTEKSTATRRQLNDQSEAAADANKKSVAHLNDLSTKLEEAIKILNDSLARAPTKARITHDDELNRYVVRIADADSGEVIKEIPSDELLRFARHLEKLKGILFDKRA